MKVFLFILLFAFSACYLPESAEGPISNTGPILDSGGNNLSTATNLIGQTWKITHYRVGEMGQMIQTNDTLEFITATTYKFNGIPSKYSLYVTGSGYNLTLNETPWGNLSGSIVSYNLTNGTIPGIRFANISLGSSNNTIYYLWLIKI